MWLCADTRMLKSTRHRECAVHNRCVVLAHKYSNPDYRMLVKRAFSKV